MAWNEPGNNSDNNGGDRHGGRKDNDPWSQSNQGPPDLDEALEKLKAQFSGILGLLRFLSGRPKRASGDSSSGPIPRHGGSWLALESLVYRSALLGAGDARARLSGARFNAHRR